MRKKEKQNRAADANMAEWRQIQGLLDKIRGTGRGGISADDPEAVTKLRVKLKELEQNQEKMKAVNAYYRKNKALEGCPQLSSEEIERLKASMARNWRPDPKPYESFALTNNSANIRRVKARIAELTQRAETEYQGWAFEGGAVKMDKEANRLQVFFDEKPDRETCSAMRHSGFKWAPSVGAWQRQLNDNAVYAAKHLDFLKPVEHPQAELVSDSVSVSGWGFYIVADLKTWADNAENRSPLEHFSSFEEARARFAELRDMPFIAANKDLAGRDKGATRCLLVTTRGNQDGILVDSQGSNYARYSAYVPDKRSLNLRDVPVDHYDLKLKKSLSGQDR